MGLLGLLLGGVLIWLMWTGRMRRPGARQIAALILSLAGGAIAARGRPIIGGGMAAAGLAWLSIGPKPARQQRPDARQEQPDETTRAALDLLGLPATATREDIIAAHRRLIARNHPDTGGTEALARSINAARDHLLDMHGK